MTSRSIAFLALAVLIMAFASRGARGDSDSGAAGIQIAPRPGRSPSGERRKTVFRAYKDAEGYDVYESDDGVHKEVRRDLPRNVVEAPGPGKPSKASLEAQGFVFIDRYNGDSVRRLSPGRYEVSYTTEDGRSGSTRVELPGLADPRVTVAFKELEAGQIRYVYDLENRRSSEQPILAFGVNLPRADIILSASDSSGWLFDHMVGSGPPLVLLQTQAAWLPLGKTPLLAPGRAVRDLSIVSAYLPGVTDTFILTAPVKRYDPPLLDYLSEGASAFLGEIEEREGRLRPPTIGPMIPPPGAEGLSRDAVFERLEQDVDRAAAASFVSSGSVAAVKDVIARARERLDGPEALPGIKASLGAIPGVDAAYRSGLEKALGVLSHRGEG